MTVIKINKCSDSMLWYARLVGTTVTFIREVDEGYLSREPAGYLNIVRRDDAELIQKPTEVIK